MNNLILQPAGNSGAREHYLDTVSNSIQIDKIIHLISSEQEDLLRIIYPSGSFYCWGVTPSQRNQNKWEKINSGDVTLFARDRKIFAKATTTIKFHNQKLANHLWGTDNDGRTWEFMYFLDEVSELNVTYQKFNSIIGYQPNYIIQGFNVLDSAKAKPVFDALELWSATFYPDISEDEYISAISALTETDARSQSSVRLEQGYLRRKLFQNRVHANCASCGEIFPVSFLVTAHIKPRKHCSHEERLDENVVFPMCNFGCDQLYEIGGIVVDNSGFIKRGVEISNITETVKLKLESLIDSKVDLYCQNNAKYFKWHYEFFINN